MYAIDENDKVVALDIPAPDTGDPLPIVLSKDGTVILSYISLVARKDMCVIVSFPVCAAHTFVESKIAHPLAARGLKPFGAYEVKDSSWVRRDFGGKGKHFAFAFRDSIFECVAEDFGLEINEEEDDAIKLMSKRLYK